MSDTECIQLTVVREQSFLEAVDHVVVASFFASFVFATICTIAVMKYVRYALAIENNRVEAAKKQRLEHGGRKIERRSVSNFSCSHEDIESFYSDDDTYCTGSSICLDLEVPEKKILSDRDLEAASTYIDEAIPLTTHYVSHMKDVNSGVVPSDYALMNGTERALETCRFELSDTYLLPDLSFPVNYLLFGRNTCIHDVTDLKFFQHTCKDLIFGSNETFHYFGSILPAYAKSALSQLVHFCLTSLKAGYFISQEKYHYATSMVEQRMQHLNIGSMNLMFLFPDHVNSTLTDLETLLQEDVYDNISGDQADAVNGECAIHVIKSSCQKVREQYSAVLICLLKLYAKQLADICNCAGNRGLQRIQFEHQLWSSTSLLRLRNFHVMRSINGKLSDNGHGMEDMERLMRKHEELCKKSFIELHSVVSDQSKKLMEDLSYVRRKKLSAFSDELQLETNSLILKILSKDFKQEALDQQESFGNGFMDLLSVHFERHVNKCIQLDQEEASVIIALLAQISNSISLKLASCEEISFCSLLEGGLLSENEVLSLASSIQEYLKTVKTKSKLAIDNSVQAYINAIQIKSKWLQLFLESTVYLVSSYYKLSSCTLEVILKSIGGVSEDVKCYIEQDVRQKVSMNIFRVAVFFICRLHCELVKKSQGQHADIRQSLFPRIATMLSELQSWSGNSESLLKNCCCSLEPSEDFERILIELVRRLYAEQAELSSVSIFSLLHGEFSIVCDASLEPERRQWMLLQEKLQESLETGFLSKKMVQQVNAGKSSKPVKGRSKYFSDALEDMYESQQRLKAAKLCEFRSGICKDVGLKEIIANQELSSYAVAIELALASHRNYVEGVNKVLSGMLSAISMDSVFYKKYVLDGILQKISLIMEDSPRKPEPKGIRMSKKFSIK